LGDVAPTKANNNAGLFLETLGNDEYLRKFVRRAVHVK